MELAASSSGDVDARSRPNDTSQALSVLLKMLGGHVDADQRISMDRGEQDAAWWLEPRKNQVFARGPESHASRLDKLALPALAQSKDGGFFILASARNDRASYTPRMLHVQYLSRSLRLWSDSARSLNRVNPLVSRPPSASSGSFPRSQSTRDCLRIAPCICFHRAICSSNSNLFSSHRRQSVGSSRLNDTGCAGVSHDRRVTFDVTLGGLRSFVFSHTACRVDVQLGAKLFSHLLALPLAYFDSRPADRPSLAYVNWKPSEMY